MAHSRIRPADAGILSLLSSDSASGSVGSSRRLVAIGASVGGLNAFSVILAALPADFPAPVVLVQHLSADFPSKLAQILGKATRLPVKQAQQGDRLQVGHVYIAPPGEHLLVNPDYSLSLSLAPKVHHCRPSADVLFESVAGSCGTEAIGIVLTGGDGDGSTGIRAIKAAGGVTIAQDVLSSQQPSMPIHAAATGSVDFVLPLMSIAPALITLVSTASAPNPSLVLPPAVLLEAESTALARVQAAWRSAGQFSGGGAGPGEANRLVTQALAELDGCIEALVVAESALVDQNSLLESFQDALRTEHSRYQELFQTVSDALIETDKDSIIRTVSPAAAKLLGRNGGYMVRRPFANYVHPRERDAFEGAALEELALGGSGQPLSLRARTGLPAVSAAAVAIKDNEGNVISLLWRVHLDNEVGPESKAGLENGVGSEVLKK